MEVLLILQIVFIFIIFGLCFLCVVLPLKLVPQEAAHLSPKSRRIISYSSCFSGGVFLGTCFLQLIPFIEDKFLSVFYISGVNLEYASSVTQVAVVLGFFLILLIEQLVRVCQSKEQDKLETVELLKSPNDFLIPSSSDEICSDESEIEIYNEEHHTSHVDHVDMEDDIDGSEQSKLEDNIQTPMLLNAPQYKKVKQVNGKISKSTAGNHSHGPPHKHGHSHSHTGGGHGHSHLADIVKEDFGLRCLLLLFALSIHSLFEGTAVGLQDNLYKFGTLMIGVALHEMFVAFAIGINLAQQKLHLATVLKICVVFSSTIPIGMAIGLVLKGFTSIFGQIVSASIQGLTAGTFIYVTFLEIIPAEINSPEGRMLKVLFMFLGFVVIACLKFGIKEDMGQIKAYYLPQQSP